MNSRSPAPSEPPVKAPPTPLDRTVLILSFLVFALCCGGWLWLGMIHEESGWDFTGFYLAGNVPLVSLYDQTVVQEYGRRLLEPLGIQYYPPYVRPAVFSLAWRPLMGMPYWTAFAVWAALQFGFYLGSLALLSRVFRFPVELVVGFGLFYPGLFGIITGQDASGFLFLLATGLFLLLTRRDKWAGVVLAGTLYKFNVALLIPVLLLLQKKYQALRWMLGVGALLMAASSLLTPIDSYLELLANIPNYTTGFTPRNMVSLRSPAHALGAPEVYYILGLMVAAFCVVAMRRLPAAEGFSIAVLGSLLCSYHATWYDGTLLMIPTLQAFAGSSTAAKLSSAVLVFVFFLWPYQPAVMVALMLVLMVALARPWEWRATAA